MKKYTFLFVGFVLLALVLGCNSGPVPLEFGKDGCEFCKMILMDPKFGCEIVTDKGRVYKFDDINCMIQYMEEQNLDELGNHQFYIIDYHQPGHLIDAREAHYLYAEEIRTPMAARTVAFGDIMLRQKFSVGIENPKFMTWSDIVEYFKKNMH